MHGLNRYTPHDGAPLARSFATTPLVKKNLGWHNQRSNAQRYYRITSLPIREEKQYRAITHKMKNSRLDNDEDWNEARELCDIRTALFF